MRNSPSEMPGTSPSRIAKFSDRGMPCGRDVSQTCRLIAFGIRPSQCDATNGHYSSSPMDFTLVQFMVQECLAFRCLQPLGVSENSKDHKVSANASPFDDHQFNYRAPSSSIILSTGGAPRS